MSLPRASALLAAGLALAAGCDRLRRRAPAPPFLAYVEAEPGGARQPAALKVFPLMVRTGAGWKDASFDPDVDAGDWKTLPPERFPLAAKPDLQAFASGRALGTLRIQAVGPEAAACGELVLGRAVLKPVKGAAPPPRFLGLHALPPQADFTCSLPPAPRKAAQEALERQAREVLGIPAGALTQPPAWGWFQGGPGLGACVAASLAFRLPSGDGEAVQVAVWNGVAAVDGRGAPRVLWTSSGTGEETEPPERFEFLDVVDLDGDGGPELLFRSSAYETQGFALLALGPGAPRMLWSGSEYGC